MALDGDQLTSELAALKINRDEPPPRSILKPLIYLAIVVAIALTVWLVGYPYLDSRVFKTEVELTEIALVSPAQGSIELTATGYVEPETFARVAAKTIGRISEVKFKEGDVLKKGDIIAVLDDSTARNALAAARSRVATSRARAQAARAQLAEVQLQSGRERVLAEKGVSPRATVADLVAKEHSLLENVRAAEAEINATAAEVEMLEGNLEDMKVTAAIDGTVVEKMANEGELVGPQAQSLALIVDFSSLIVKIDVPEAKLSLVKIGGPCEIVLDAFPGKRYRGAVKEIGKKIDRAKATASVKIRFVDPPEGALPDMAGRVSFLAKELDASAMKEPAKLVVPESAVFEKDGASYVYIVKDDRLSLTNVQVGDKLGAGYVMRNGPPPGTKVVSNPSDKLRDGQLIKEKNE